MTQHASQFLGQFRKLARQIIARKGQRPTWANTRNTLEPMEERKMLTAAFFAPAETSGTVDVQLVPLSNVTAGVQEVVTFGVPFTRGSVTAAQLANLRVLKGGVEVRAFVEQLTPWRNIGNAGIDGQSVRVARVQIPYTFATLNPETITVQWGGPVRTQNFTFQDPRIEWHTVTSGTFVSGDNVQEPDVLPVLPKATLAKGVFDSQVTPDASGVLEARDNPATMDTMTFNGYEEYDYAEKNFFYTIINQNGGLSTIDYKTQSEPWLYDRSTAMFEVYFRSGYATPLREAIRSTDFYLDHLDGSGFFTLKSGDPKYSYNECLAYTYWLLGDNAMLPKISTVVNAFSSTATHWTPTLGFFTERNAGDKMLANVIAYEVTGTTSYKTTIQTIVSDFVWHQNGADGQLPANRIDGGLYHIGWQHDSSEVTDPNVIIASPWMSALIVDPVVRTYGVWDGSTDIPNFLMRIGNFEKTASKWDTNGQFGGNTRYPDYLMRYDGVSENRSGYEAQHAMDVGGEAAWANYFAELRGTPDSTLRQLATDLYATYDLGVNYWTSTGSGFSVSPPRRYTWEYKNSSNFAWAMNATGSSPGALQFSGATYSVNESGPTVTITVTRTGGTSGTVGVHYATSNGTATAGSDYTATSGNLSFVNGDTSETFTIPITNDTTAESNETVNLTLSSPTGGATLGSPATSVLTIVDNDSGGTIHATYQQGVNGYTGTVDAAIRSNGATDFTGPYVRNLNGGYQIEGLFKFTNLNIPVGSTVTGATLTLNCSDYAVTHVTGYYVLPTWNGTAGQGLDWTYRSTGSAWNTPGAQGQGTDLVSGKSFTFTTNSSGGGQIFNITLDASVVQSWVNNANADQGIVLMTQFNDPYVDVNTSENATVANRPVLAIDYTSAAAGTLQFSGATYSVNETGPVATVTVTRTGGTSGTVGVSYATSNGTATAGSDYTTTSGTLSFLDGQTSKTFDIPITNDTLVESNETVNLTLSNPTGGATLGSQSTSVLTIVSDDAYGNLQFSGATYSVNESGPTATITVTRTNGTAGTVGVHYATSNGTATAGSDYTATSGDLSFLDGQTSKTFTIPITNDSAVESNETVNLTLSSPTGGATLGSPTTSVLTIVDNDNSQPVTVTYQQGVSGYAGNTDVSISSQGGGNGTTNFNSTYVRVYSSASYNTEDIFNFSSLGIPSGSTVSNASLTIKASGWHALTVTGYYVLASWNGTPGQGLGWLNRSTGNTWNTPGAMGQGTDVISGKSFTINIAATGDQTFTIPLDTAVVQSWVDNAGANQGFVLKDITDSQYVDFYTDDNATVSNRPLLSITYTPGGGQSPIQMGPELLALAAQNGNAKTRSTPLALGPASASPANGLGNGLAKLTGKTGVYRTLGDSQDDGLSTIDGVAL